MNDDYLLPVLKNKSKCKKCMSCVNACPVNAITYEDDIFNVNKEVCKKFVRSKRDKECFICILAC
ncbi:MAG: 4Fe-4S binding protein [Candidatus Helarchaeota archaeon]